MKIPDEKRPTCSCGAKMKVVEYKGYYDSFNYWECDNCDLDADIQGKNVETDKFWNGDYA